MNEFDFSDRAFDRAADDVRRVVRDIAGRYARRGHALTWQVLHAIEDEALADLGLASRHGAELLGMFARPPESDYPRGDVPVQLDDATTTPLIFWFALEAYGVTGRVSSAWSRTRIEGRHAAATSTHHVRPF